MLKLDRLLGKRSLSEAQVQLTFSRRAFVLGGAQAAFCAVLAGRMAWLSIAENDRYQLLAESNRVNLSLIPPRRGWIVDRAGKPLALNKTVFRVDVIKDRLKDRDAELSAVQAILGFDGEERQRILDDLDQAAGFQPVQIAENLDWEHFAALSVRQQDLPGIIPAQGFARHYPTGAAVGQLLGYVGTASAADFEASRDPLLITPGYKVGKAGVEKVLQERLKGAPGARRSEVTARGKLVRELETRADVPGETVRLTIDAGLQDYAARRLGNNSGAVTVIDTATGAILAMASMPSFDPNAFTDGIGRMEWQRLSDDKRKPLVNKVLQSLYPPGSTLKPAAALAFLLAGVDPDERVNCRGGYQLGNRFFRCLGRHGPISMRDAIAKSCNTYFYAMAHRLGYDRIARECRELGLGAEFDLPVTSQRYGTIPDSAWKQRKFGQPWSHSDTLNAVIGQGYVITSPFQLAVMSARIASGHALVPHLIGKPPQAPHLSSPDEHLAIVREGMTQVVSFAGTAGRSMLDLPGIAMAGKTGTAQVRRIAGSQRGQSGEWRFRDHGLFVCFAPTDQPRYAASVVIEHGMGGARAAAPVAKDVLTYLFAPEQAMATLVELEKSWGGDILTRMAREAAGEVPIPSLETPT